MGAAGNLEVGGWQVAHQQHHHHHHQRTGRMPEPLSVRTSTLVVRVRVRVRVTVRATVRVRVRDDVADLRLREQ